MPAHNVRTAILIGALALLPTPLLAADGGGCGPQTDVAADARLSNVAKWSSKSEVMSKSFDVFRGESEDGNFERINPEPIVAAGWSARPRVYEYKDSDIDPCREYFYYVEALSEDGSRHRVTETLKAKAKREASDSAK
jgi:hypothetical protein